MTTKRKKKKTLMGGRTLTVSLSLCLLAVVAMAGMYAVGKSEQEQAELEQQIAEAEELAKAREAAQAEEAARQEELKREQQAAAAASAAAQRQREEEPDVAQAEEADITVVAELESDFVVEEPELTEAVVVEEVAEAAETVAEEIALSFSPDTDILLWPVAGNIILDYSMDKSVYFSTLDQYKYNPAVIIQGTVDESVLCGAQGKVASIEKIEETGTTVTVDIGSGYELVYGQLKELTVGEGDYVNEGQTIGYVSEPTYYYAKEGSNVYFEVRKDGESIDPMSLLQ